MRENSGRLLQLSYASGLDEIVCRYRVERGHGALRVSGLADVQERAARAVKARDGGGLGRARAARGGSSTSLRWQGGSRVG